MFIVYPYLEILAAGKMRNVSRRPTRSMLNRVKVEFQMFEYMLSDAYSFCSPILHFIAYTHQGVNS